MTIHIEANSASDIADEFHRDGVVIIPSVLNKSSLIEIIDNCEKSISDMVGTRNLSSFDWVVDLAEELTSHDKIRSLLGPNTKLVQCNYFSKSSENNWFVSLHRDLSIPVERKIESEKWSGWSVKEGKLYAQPPRAVLESLIAIRIHFEDNNEINGALQVVKGSHRLDSTSNDTTVCRLKAGSALIINPLVLHKSAKLKSGSRRVLHFIFGPHHLPDGASWPDGNWQF